MLFSASVTARSIASLNEHDFGKFCISRLDIGLISLTVLFCEWIRVKIEDAIRKEILARIKILLPITIAAIGQKELDEKLYSQTTT